MDRQNDGKSSQQLKQGELNICKGYVPVVGS